MRSDPGRASCAVITRANQKPAVADSPGKGRGKAAKIPLDVDDLLEFEGVGTKDTTLDGVLAKLQSGCFTTIRVAAPSRPAVEQVYKDVLKASKLYSADILRSLVTHTPGWLVYIFYGLV